MLAENQIFREYHANEVDFDRRVKYLLSASLLRKFETHSKKMKNRETSGRESSRFRLTKSIKIVENKASIPFAHFFFFIAK